MTQYHNSPVDQIKQRLNIVDVVGSYIKLQKAGANHKAACPFHSEKAPSFYVSPPREIWHCFGCNRGGDMFEFVKQIEGVEFIDALRILADRAGVVITRQDSRLRNEKTNLLDILKDSTFFYQKELTKNKEALSYLRKRGLTNDTLKKFNIGYSPPEENGWRNLFNYLKGKGYSAGDMEKAGLVIRKQNEENRNQNTDYYDRFRGRIMFPLKDASGRVVGFSGRIFKEKPGFEAGKYINTPQTILYDKSDVLYGFDLAKVEIRKKDACILVEGQMDVLMAHQAGTENTVAVSGTALTDQHLLKIKRLTETLIMAFDSDEAGLDAAKRSIDLALEKEFEVRAVSLPQGKDPADVILEDKKTWVDSVDKARHIIDFYLDVLAEKYKKDPRHFKLEVQKKVLPYVLSIRSEIEKTHWISEIAQKIDVNERIVWEDFKKMESAGRSKKQKTPRAQLGGEVFVESAKKRKSLLGERIIGIYFWKKDKSLLPDFVKESFSNLFGKDEKDYRERLGFEAELYYGGMDDIAKEHEYLVKEFKKEDVKERLEKLAEEVSKLESGSGGSGEGDLEKKLEEFRKLSQELSQI